MIFSISGYWKDDKSEFEDYIVTDFDDTPEEYEDEEIFFFGLSEDDLTNSSEDDMLDFVVTFFKKIE